MSTNESADDARERFLDQEARKHVDRLVYFAAVAATWAMSDRPATREQAMGAVAFGKFLSDKAAEVRAARSQAFAEEAEEG